MRKNILKDLGTINIERLEVMNGQIEVFIPVEVASEELAEVFERCENRFKEAYPEITNVAFNVNLIFSFGYVNPEFELQILVFDKEEESTVEEYDSLFLGDIELSDEQKKQIKKVMWDRLGETFLNM